MPFVSKESFRATDAWLTDTATTNADNFNDEYFGSNPVPYSLAALKAHAVFGDAGTGAPANGASANDAAFAAGDFVTLGNETRAEWDGTAWVVYS